MGKLRTLSASLLLAAALPVLASAQERGTVTGTVTATESGSPLSAANISVDGTSLRTVTDAQGRYRITVPAGQRTIRVSTIGRQGASRSVSVAAGETATANFALSTSAVALEGVVVNAVTGQVQRRVEAGTNVGQVNVAELNKGPITQATDILQGRVTGVTLQGASGQAGSGQRIRIRGANSLSLSNDPLVYIDGVLSSTSRGGIALGGQDYSRLNDINPEDIQNMEILKGPAASAIYGTAAANGVILITTRRGRAGRAVWRAYAEAGQVEDVNEFPANYISLQRRDGQPATALPYDTLTGFINTTSYLVCPNFRAGIPTGQTVAGQSGCRQDVSLAYNFFEDERTRPFEVGNNSKLGVSVSGGTEGLTYYISGDRQTEQGTIQPNDLERINLRTNLTARLSSQANLSVNVGYVTSNTNRISSDNSVFSPFILGLTAPAQFIPGQTSDTISRTPGTQLPPRRGALFRYNFADQQVVTADQSVDRFIVGSNGSYRPFTWLSLNGNVGLDFFSRFDRQSQDPNRIPLSQSYILGFRDSYRADNYQWTGNASAIGTFDLTDNVVATSTVGGSFQRQTFEQVNCFGAGIAAGTRSCSATTSLFSVAETYTDQRTLGAFARQELAIGDRLFLGASIRADNNSGLVSGLIYYPSANASWVVSSEPFFPEGSFVSQLRLRVAAGQSGQRPGFGDAETFFGVAAVQAGAADLPALILSNTGNPNLRPERTTEYEAGFDLGLFGDRLSADYTYFTRRSEDALVARNLPPSAGLGGSVYQNLGSIRNWGQELGVNAEIINRDRIRFSARLAATTLRNRIEELGRDIAPITVNGAQQHREGFATGGFFSTPYTYADADGNGKITRNEVKVDSSRFQIVASQDTARLRRGFTRDTLNVAYLGTPLPTNTQGLSGELTLFRNITISTLFERRAGNKQLNETEYFRCRQQGGTSGQGASFSQCAALGNPNASLEEQARYIASQFNEYNVSRAGFIEDADFVKWRELSVRLGVPETWGARFPLLRGAALSVNGRNLRTWTDYTGLDPEINTTGGGANFGQSEFNTQPPARSYTVRFDFNF